MVLHANIIVRDNTAVGGGRGLYATASIPRGSVVWREDDASEPQFASTPRSIAWVEALPPASQAAYRHFMYKTGEARRRGEKRRPTRRGA